MPTDAELASLPAPAPPATASPATPVEPTPPAEPSPVPVVPERETAPAPSILVEPPSGTSVESELPLEAGHAQTAAPVTAPNPLAPAHLPWFITAPGGTDYLLVAMAALLIAALIAIGNLYFQLHALPERWAHQTSPFQIEIIAVLSLLALFTHQHLFWIAALLIALVRFPDFSTPLNSMAASVERLARWIGPERRAREPGADLSPKSTEQG
jgi:hypothetical protein